LRPSDRERVTTADPTTRPSIDTAGRCALGSAQLFWRLGWTVAVQRWQGAAGEVVGLSGTFALPSEADPGLFQVGDDGVGLVLREADVVGAASFGRTGKCEVLGLDAEDLTRVAGQAVVVGLGESPWV
jgi:hypothetical protein